MDHNLVTDFKGMTNNKVSLNEKRDGHVGAILKQRGHYRPLPEDMNDSRILTTHPHPNLKMVE